MSAGNVNYELEASFTGLGLRKVSQIVEYGDLTDGGGTTGTLDLNKQVPAGSFVIGSKVTVKTAFDGANNVLAIGTSGDDNEYSGNTTHDISSAASNLVKAASISSAAGIIAEGSDISVKLTVTDDSSFGGITAGRMLIEVFYFSTNVELTDGGRVKSDL